MWCCIFSFLRFYSILICSSYSFAASPEARLLTPKDMSVHELVTGGMIGGEIKGHQVYGLSAFAGLMQGISSDYSSVIKYLQPYEGLPPVVFSDLDKKQKKKFVKLPGFPDQVKVSDTPLLLQVFVFVSSAFGKTTDPVYLYATSDHIPGNALPPLSQDIGSKIRGLPDTIMTLYRKFQSLHLCVKAVDGLAEYLRSPEIYVAQYFKAPVDVYAYFLQFGVLEAQFYYSKCLKAGGDIAADPEKSFELMSVLADEYDIGSAQCCCGHMLANSIGVALNTSDAIQYMVRASRNGDQIAKSSLILAVGMGITTKAHFSDRDWFLITAL